MEIKNRFKHVDGSFETDTGKLSCVPSRKYAVVSLCFKSGMHIQFADIEFYSSGLWKDAEAVFDDAAVLGEEIVRRWNLVN